MVKKWRQSEDQAFVHIMFQGPKGLGLTGDSERKTPKNSTRTVSLVKEPCKNGVTHFLT